MARFGLWFCFAMGLALISIRPAAAGVADPVLLGDLRHAGYWEKVTFTSLQGLANRDRGRLMFITHGSDEHWARWYHKHKGIRFQSVRDPYALPAKLADCFAGYVVVDMEAPDTANLATNYAASEDLLPVTMNMLKDHPDLPDKPVKVDLRGRFRGRSSLQIYQWALKHQWPNANKSVLGNLNAAMKVADLPEDVASSDTLYLRVEDSKPSDGHGANITWLGVLSKDRTLARINPGTPEEAQSIVEQKGTELSGKTRHLNREDMVLYKLSGVGGAERLVLNITNQYRVSVSTTPRGDYRQVAQSTNRRSRFEEQAAVRDYVVARRGFALRLTSRGPSRERKLKERFERQMPTMGLVLGWGSEQALVKQASSHGLLVLATNTASNLSFHRYVQADGPLRQRHHAKKTPAPVDPDKVYLTFVMSDGDSPNFVYDLMHGQWNDQTRGEIPFGWEMQPLFADLAPGIAEYYYQTAKPNEEFVAAASGIGYFFPDKMPMPKLRRVLRAAETYLRRTDLSALTVIQSPGGGRPRHSVSKQVKQLYARLLGGQLRGVIEGYWPTAGSNQLIQGMPWMPTQLPTLKHGGGKPPERLVRGIQKVAKDNPQRPLFIPIHVPKGRMRVHDVVEAVGRLDTEHTYKVLGPEEFLQAYRRVAAGGGR